MALCCGGGGGGGEEVDLELRKKNADCSKAAQMALQDDLKIIKMLLLGAGESGKSTIFKQMKVINKGGYTDAERAAFKSIVYSNTIASMKTLASAHERVQNLAEDPEVKAMLEQLEKATEENEVLDADAGGPTVGALIKKMWLHPTIQKNYENKSSFQLNDSALYYFDAIDRLSDPGYIPDEQDVLRSRVRTTGIVQSDFKIKGINFSMFDVGGQRNERRKWIHCFDNVHAVVFVAALSEFDQVLYEDDTQNRMVEALDLFKQISNSKWFAQTAIILFLNKKDLFEIKLSKCAEKGKSMADFCTIEKGFSEPYTGENDYEACVEYWKTMFCKQPQDKNKNVYTHATCATDTSNVKFVFNSVVSIVLEENMKASGLA